MGALASWPPHGLQTTKFTAPGQWAAGGDGGAATIVIMSGKRCKLAAIAMAIAHTALLAVAQTPAERAAPPTFSDADLEPFFPDAREALVGERPVAATASTRTLGDGKARANANFEWSQLVEGDTLATEVKRIATNLAEPLASPAAFKSGGNKVCRGEFAMLAVLFAVIEQYDGDVRWQPEAAALREASSRVSDTCRTASDQSYAAAVRLRDDLDELIRGGRLANDAAQPLEKWSQLADRTLLMRRMEQAMQNGVNPRLSDAKVLAKSAADVRHEAELLALLADVIDREEFDYWDDETFTGYSRDLGSAAGDLARAAADGNYEAARAAAGAITNACAACHDGYRG
jgi:cytochrome c556